MPPDDSLFGVVDRLTNAVDDYLPVGDVAELRRLRWEDPPGLAFWKALALVRGDSLVTLQSEARWVAVVQALAETRGLRQAQTRGLGVELAEAGFSELRLQRLLRSDEATFLDEVRAAGRYLAAKGRGLKPRDLATLVLVSKDADDPGRRRIARQYFRTIHAATTAD